MNLMDAGIIKTMTSDAIPQSTWIHHGDNSPRDRLLRVFDYHDVEWWETTNDIRFVTNESVLLDDVERALDGSEWTCEKVSSSGQYGRYRVSEPEQELDHRTVIDLDVHKN